MWNYVDVFKNLERNKRLKAERDKRRRKQEKTFRLTRIPAEVRIGGVLEKSDFIPARLFLNDFHSKSLRLFVAEPVDEFQNVSININDEKTFYVKGVVRRCVLFGLDSHVIAKTVYPYRLEIQLKFRDEREELSIERYADAFFRRHVLGMKNEVNEFYPEAGRSLRKKNSRVISVKDQSKSPSSDIADIPSFDELDLFKRGA